MKHIALIAALAVFSAPAFADGKRIAPVPPDTPELELTANAATTSAGHGLDDADAVLVSRCNKAGGGMMTTNEGTYRCMGRDGQEIPY
jgi:hypothetical protein